jgi:hypothetical protein
MPKRKLSDGGPATATSRSRPRAAATSRSAPPPLPLGDGWPLPEAATSGPALAPEDTSSEDGCIVLNASAASQAPTDNALALLTDDDDDDEADGGDEGDDTDGTDSGAQGVWRPGENVGKYFNEPVCEQAQVLMGNVCVALQRLPRNLLTSVSAELAPNASQQLRKLGAHVIAASSLLALPAMGTRRCLGLGTTGRGHGPGAGGRGPGARAGGRGLGAGGRAWGYGPGVGLGVTGLGLRAWGPGVGLEGFCGHVLRRPGRRARISASIDPRGGGHREELGAAAGSADS